MIMSEFFNIKSITQVHQFLGLGKPLHPLIMVIRDWPNIDFDFLNVKITSDLYLIGLKGNAKGSFRYGRNTYDYEEGSLTFLAPHQALTFDQEEHEKNQGGWSIIFHPDLIRKSELGKNISQYSFFDYHVNESLHVSEKEKQLLLSMVENIETELQQNIDKHSQDLIIVSIQSILKYCERFYDRQFYTRTNANKDHVSQFEQYLEDYFAGSDLADKGLPTVSQCGKALNMSPGYLSDLLKIETGRSAKGHIHDFIVEKAKTLLLSTNVSIGEVAYSLGFEYPQHFSKMFKSKTGVNPSAYRSMN